MYAWQPYEPYDSRLIWRYYDYGAAGIDVEPYFDISLERSLYLTDTGRRWNGSSVSIRDKVYSRNEEYYEEWGKEATSRKRNGNDGSG